MDDATHRHSRRERAAPCRAAGAPALPEPSNEERSFWRRAVEIERARLGRPRPAPFPFQEA
jgi:hypothetical protein